MRVADRLEVLVLGHVISAHHSNLRRPGCLEAPA